MEAIKYQFCPDCMDKTIHGKLGTEWVCARCYKEQIQVDNWYRDEPYDDYEYTDLKWEL